jgi:hypothetical protein
VTEQVNDNELYLIPGLDNWDEPIVTEISEGGGATIFAGWKLYRVPVNPFAKEVSKTSFTIPGVYQYRESLKEGLFEFPFPPGKTSAGHYLCILVALRTNSQGAEYQSVRYFKSWGEGEKTTEINPKNGKPVYKNHQVLGEKLFPALKVLLPTERAKLDKGEMMWAKAVETSAGFSNPSKDGSKVYEFTYYDEWETYPTQEALRVAEKVFFAGKGTSNGTGLDLLNFPGGDWASDDPATLQTNYKNLKEFIQEVGYNTSLFVPKAIEASLVNKLTGKVVSRINSDQPVDLAELFAKMLDIPVDDDIKAAFNPEAIKAAIGKKK